MIKLNMQKLRAKAIISDGFFVPCMTHTIGKQNPIVIHSAYLPAMPNDPRASFGYMARLQLLEHEGRRSSTDKENLKSYVLLDKGKLVSIQFPGEPITFELFFKTLPHALDFFKSPNYLVVIRGGHIPSPFCSIPEELTIQYHIREDTKSFIRCAECTSNYFGIILQNEASLLPHSSDDGLCCVCLDPMRRSLRRNGNTTTLLCGHSIHTQCMPKAQYVWEYYLVGLTTWAREVRCPLCRYRFYMAETSEPDTSLMRLAQDLDDYYSDYDDHPRMSSPHSPESSVDYEFDL